MTKAGQAPMSARERWLVARLGTGIILDIGFAGQKQAMPAYYGVLERDRRIVFGLDFAEAVVLERRQPRSIVGDARRLPIPDNSVDGVILGEFLEHQSDLVPFFRECHRVLRPGGQLLLTTPNPFFINRLVRRWLFKRRGAHLKPGNVQSAMGYFDHMVLWDPLSLMHLLGRQGFAMRDATALGFWIPGLGRIFPSFRRGLYIDVWPFNRLGYISCMEAIKRD